MKRKCTEDCKYSGYCLPTSKEYNADGCDAYAFLEWAVSGYTNMIISIGKLNEVLCSNMRRTMNLVKSLRERGYLEEYDRLCAEQECERNDS